MKKLLLTLFVMVAAAGLVVAGAEGEGAQAEDVTVTMYKWGLPAGQEDWSEMEGLITAATGVDIDMIQAPSFTDYQTKVATLLSSGDTSIDLFDIDEYITYGNILGGFFEPLNDIFSAEDLAAFPKTYMDQMATYEGNIVGVPHGFSWFPMYLNKRQLDAAGLAIPTTGEDYLEVTQVLTKDDVFGFGDGWTKGYITNFLQYIIYVHGGDYFDWDDPCTQEAVKLMHDLINTYEVAPRAILADDYGALAQKLLDGKLASTITWDWIVSVAVSQGKYGSELIVAETPKWSDDADSDITLMGAWLYVLSSASERKDAAKKVLGYMLSEEAATAEAKMVGNAVPLRSDSLEEPVFNDPEKWPAVPILKDMNARDKLWPRPMAGRMSDILDSTENSLYEYLNQNIDLEEAVKRANRELDRLLGGR